jgi:hypothetical protein
MNLYKEGKIEAQRQPMEGLGKLFQLCLGQLLEGVLASAPPQKKTCGTTRITGNSHPS